MIEHNAFCNSEPQEDALCGCVDNYDLTDWNDIEPPDWEGGDAPHQRSCLDVYKRQVLEVYDPSCHHYEADPPTWTEIEPGHFVLANQEELEKYRTMI